MRGDMQFSQAEEAVPPSIFDVEVLPGGGKVLDLGKVLDNGNHVLRRLKLSNRSSGALRVVLSSDRPQEISFQLHNENLNGAEAGGNLESDFNELFNTIDLVDAVHLPPNTQLNIVLLYLPSEEIAATEEGRERGRAAGAVGAGLGEGGRGGARINSSLSVRGAVSFSAHYLHPDHRPAPAPHPDHPQPGSQERRRSDAEEAEQGGAGGKVGPGSGSAGVVASVKTLDLVAQVCRSLLAVHPNAIVFGGCVPGAIYYRDFTLQNLSEVPLSFATVMSAEMSEAVAGKTLALSECEVDQDEGESLEGLLKSGEVPSLASVRVRVTFRPQQVGEMVFEATFENRNNQPNRETVRIVALVADQVNEEGLEVSLSPWRAQGALGGHGEEEERKVLKLNEEIDFGNCYTGIGERKVMIIHNVTQKRLSVFFSTDAHDDVRFDLHTDLQEDSDEEEEGAADLASPYPQSRGKLLREGSGAEGAGRASRRPSAASAGDASERLSSPGREGKGEAGGDGRAPSDEGDSRSRRNSGSKEAGGGGGGGQGQGNLGAGSLGVVQKQRGVDEEEEVKARHGRIEELDLLPGQEKGVVVWYCPSVAQRAQAWQAGGEGAGRVPGTTYDKGLATLSKRDFQVVLKAMYSTEASLGRLDLVHAPAPQSLALHSRRVMIGKARVCTSFVEVPQEVNLGDCTIGSSNKGELHLRNLSEMPCTASLRFQSKILRAMNTQSKALTTEPHVEIPPLSTVKLYLEIVPMRINPAYCKQITVVNHSNRANDGFVNLRSNNEDSNRVSLHALFYLVRTRHPSNTIYFDTIVTNSPIFRTFTLKNITATPVVLELTPSNPEAIKLYLETDPYGPAVASSKPGKPAPGAKPVARALDKAVDAPAPAPVQASAAGPQGKVAEKLGGGAPVAWEMGTGLGEGGFRGRSRSLESVVDKPEKLLLAPAESASKPQPAGDWIRTVSPGSKKREAKRGTGGSRAELKRARETWEGLKSKYETSSFFGMATRYFNTVEEERAYIKMYRALKQDLTRVIDHGVLTPATRVSIPPQSTVSLVAVFVAPNSVTEERQMGKIRSLESHINIKMLEYDKELLERAMYHKNRLVNYSDHAGEGISEIPVRYLPINAKVCRSIMEVAQRNINFGTVLANDDCTKKLIIKNLSDVPLMYQIVKPRNWVSEEFMNFRDDESMGVVKPHGQHERDFIFTPKMDLTFCETLQIVNQQDPENTVKITVKAHVRKRENFVLQPSMLDFGKCVWGERSKTIRIELTNLTSSSRTVVIRHAHLSVARQADSGEVVETEVADQAVQVQYVLERCTVVHEKVNKEEELEKMERKLRIYERKGKLAKAKKLKEKIKALSQPLPEPTGGGSDRSAGEGGSGPLSGAPSPEGSEENLGMYVSESEYSSDDQSDAEEVDSHWRRTRGDKPKKKEGQCKVKLPGKGVQTILVTITATTLPPYSASERSDSTPFGPKAKEDGEELGSVLQQVDVTGVLRGKLVVHETVNQDSSKAIDFTMHVMRGDSGRDSSWASASLQDAVKAVVNDTRRPEGERGEAVEAMGKSGTLRGYRVPKSVADAPGVGGMLAIEPEVLELSKELQLGMKEEASFVVANRGSEALRFIVMNPSGKKKEEEGKGKPGASAPAKTDLFKFSLQQAAQLEARQEMKVSLWWVPEVAGRQTHTILVRNISNQADHTLSVSFTVRRRDVVSSSFVRFPDLAEETAEPLLDGSLAASSADGAQKKREQDKKLVLDFGDCYIPPSSSMVRGAKYIKVVRLRIESVHAQDVLLTLRSNLANQILIFADEKLDRPAENVLLPGHGEVSVHVCVLAPIEGNKDAKFSNVSFGATTLWEEYNKGVTRDLVVGVTVDVQDKASKESIVQRSLKLSGRIGKSLMRLSHKHMDLGIATSLGEVRTASFTIRNDSEHLPLIYKIKPPPGVKVAKESKEDGELLGKRVDLNQNMTTVQLDFEVREHGLFVDVLEVVNLSCSHNGALYQEKREIVLYCFVDPSLVHSAPVPDHLHSLATSESGPVLHLPNNYAVPAFLGALSPEPSRPPSSSVEGAHAAESTPDLLPKADGLGPVPSLASSASHAPLIKAGSGSGGAMSAGATGASGERGGVGLEGVRGALVRSRSPDARKPRAMSPEVKGIAPKAANEEPALTVQLPNLLLREGTADSLGRRGSASGRGGPPSPTRAASPLAGGEEQRRRRPSNASELALALYSAPEEEGSVGSPKAAAAVGSEEEGRMVAVRAQARGLTVGALRLRNCGAEELVLRPLSSLNMLVHAGEPPDLLQCCLEMLPARREEGAAEAHGEGVMLPDGGKLSPRRRSGAVNRQVGELFKVPAGGEVEVHVVMLPTQSVSLDVKEKLLAGSKLPFDGPLLFEACGEQRDGEAEEGEQEMKARRRRIVHRVMVDGSWCVSVAELAGETSVDLGKIGRVKQWAPAPFELRVHNRADIPLRMLATAHPAPLSPSRKVLPHIFSLASQAGEGGQEGEREATLTVGEKESGMVQGRIRPLEESVEERGQEEGDGKVRWRVWLRNEFNPSNFFSFNVQASIITTTLLRFAAPGAKRQLQQQQQHPQQQSSADEASEFALLLPPIRLPSAADTKCSELFTVTNRSDEPVELHAYLEVDKAVEELISVDILSSSTSTHVHSFSLNPNQTMQVVVVCKGKDKVFRVPESFRGKAQVALGLIKFEFINMDFPEEQVRIMGSLSQGHTLTAQCSSSVLQWKASPSGRESKSGGGESKGLQVAEEQQWQRISLSLDALCQRVPFRVRPLPPFDTLVRLEPARGELDGESGKQTVEVAVRAPLDEEGRVRGGGGPLVLLVEDERLVEVSEGEGGETSVRVEVDLVLEEAGARAEAAMAAVSKGGLLKEGKRLPLLLLRNCKRVGEGEEAKVGVGERYEVNIGNQGLDQPVLDWTIELVYGGGEGEPLDYVVHVCKEDERWLRLKHTQGTLDNKGDTHRMVLSLATSRIGVFSSYLWIENKANPGDTKTVRVSMEVQGSHQSPLARGGAEAASSLFSVVAGYQRHTEPTMGSQLPGIDMGHIFYGQLYRTRSFIVNNDSPVPLDLSFSSNLETTSPSELCFSTTQDTLKVVRSVSLRPNTSLPIYIYFRPCPLQQPPTCPVDPAAFTGDKMSFEIYVRCRMVKDDQKVIRITATCLYASLPLHKELQAVFTLNTPFPRHLLLERGATREQPSPASAAAPGGGASPPPPVMRGAPGGALAEAVEKERGEGKGEGEGSSRGGSMVGSLGGSKRGSLPDLSDVAPMLSPALTTSTASVTVEPSFFEPGCLVVPLRNMSAYPLHLSVANDTFYFHVFFCHHPALQEESDGNTSDSSAGEVKEGVRAGGKPPASRQIVPVYDQQLIASLPLQPVQTAPSFPSVLVVPGKSERSLVLMLNKEALARKSLSVLKHRYVQEFVFLYNRENLAEYYSLSCGLSLGSIVHFTVTPGSMSSHTYAAIERAILSFLTQFNLLWHQVMSSVSEGSERGPRDTAERGQASPDAASPGGGVREVGGAGGEGGSGGQAERVKEAAERIGQHPEFRRLAFLMHSIIDGMINYGSRKHNSYVFELANLLFSVLFRHQSFEFYIKAAREWHLKAQKRKHKARARGAEAGGGAGGAGAAGGAVMRLQSHAPGAGAAGAEDAGAGEAEAWEANSVQLPMAMGMIVQQLGYLLSFFPGYDPGIQASQEVRRAEQDLQRLVDQHAPPRDSSSFSKDFAPLPADAHGDGEGARKEAAERRA